jgi:hypothetical protein
MSDPDPDGDITWFCRQVRSRSREHHEAMLVASQQRWISVAVGILRQELDSMVRVIFLLSESDRGVRAHLIGQAVSGQKWAVTDRGMVDLAESLHDWTRLVYRFGCSFIHLSYLHDYQARDPFRALPIDERRAIAQYLCDYHGGKVSPESSFVEITTYLPKVLDKITANLAIYLNHLERDGDLPGRAPRER